MSFVSSEYIQIFSISSIKEKPGEKILKIFILKEWE